VDWPVILIRPIDALAYAHWYSEQTGLSWMLPTTEQWEKTARGVDGRLYPWGDYFEPTWACVRGSKKGRPLPCSVYEYETDRSVYGVRGMAGNVQDHCISEYNDDIFYSKGGAWSYFSEYLSLSHVRENRHDVNTEVCGFRLVHSMENK
jgi:serine/threonine-protein kinase